jgi:lipopolysaccharide transport system ATP-binding protein
MATAIQVEKLSKAYQLGEIGTGTISHDLERWVAKLRGKEDPFLKVGEINDRTVVSKSNIVWSLKDINFEINQGDAVGIIGRNGAGKSTLLKLLSRVTSPTSGIIKAKGRIASLLEVGTGFHPELTGRENIYLNGAILGMRKKEIESKFDAIVDFSGVEKYIDTPVKRYSSGMYVRLAFAVAAHLESEILIVDEVLAVGDAEFQKKCLGKMKDVSTGEGRTVLFVSHNMAAIKNLCNTGIFLKYGMMEKLKNIDAIIDQYFLDETNDNKEDIVTERMKMSKAYFISWELLEGVGERSIYSRKECKIRFNLICNTSIQNVELGLVLRDNKGEIIYSCNSRDNGGDYFALTGGRYRFDFCFRFPVKFGHYEVDVAIVSREEIISQMLSKKKLQVLSEFDSPLGEKWLGILSEPLKFTHEKISN